MDNLTTESFWKEFWRTVKLPATVDLSASNDRNIAEKISQYLDNADSKVAFEVGCAPGKWLVFLNKNFGYQVEGSEYIADLAEATRENMRLNGIYDARIYSDDFLNLSPELKYDLVLSLGFIEHFNNTDPIIAKHINLLKDGGTLIIGVPNFTGIGHLIAKYLDKRGVLETHNTKIMNLSFFMRIAQKNSLSLLYCGYLGGFEPELFDISGLDTIPKFIVKILFKVLISLPAAFLKNKLSGYIIAVYKKGKL